MIAAAWGLIKGISPLMWVVVGLTVALGVQTARVQWLKSDLKTSELEVTNLNLKITIQNDSIARWKLESDRQKALVAKSSQEARSALLKWKAILDAEANDKPDVDPAKGDLAVCAGSFRWLNDKDALRVKEWSDAAP